MMTEMLLGAVEKEIDRRAMTWDVEYIEMFAQLSKEKRAFILQLYTKKLLMNKSNEMRRIINADNNS